MNHIGLDLIMQLCWSCITQQDETVQSSEMMFVEMNFSFRFFPLHALNFEQNLILSIVKFSLCVTFLKFTI